MTDDLTALQTELQQCHEYIRHMLGLFIGWFTFFLTTVLAGNAWSFLASLDKEGHLKTYGLFLGVVSFFEVQILLGISATNAVIDTVRVQDDRALELLTILRGSARGDYFPRSPVPQGLHRALGIIKTTLIVNAAVWPLVAVLADILSHFGVVMGGVAHPE